MKWYRLIRNTLRKTGCDIVTYNHTAHPIARRKKIIDTNVIDCVLDVGANAGQYAIELRDIGYKGQIISFEPLSSAYSVLESKALKDKNWTTYKMALGNIEENININIARNSQSSSILEMLPLHVKSAPESQFVNTESVEVKTLNTIYDSLEISKFKRIYLKIDTQGYEKKVLEGATNILNYIGVIQLEMSLVPLYEGELLFNDMNQYLYDIGYSLVSIELSGLSDKETGHLYQLDGVFERVNHS